jgi:hypothetical protein
VEGASLHNIQAAFDNDRVDSGYHRTHNAKCHPNNRNFGPIQKDANEKAHGDEQTSQKDPEGWTRVEGEKRGANGEWQDHASGDLVKRSVHVFKGIVAETAASFSQTVTPFAKGEGEPEADNVKTNHWNESMHDLLVKVQRNFEQAGSITGQEQQNSEDELCE